MVIVLCNKEKISQLPLVFGLTFYDDKLVVGTMKTLRTYFYYYFINIIHSFC